MKAIIIAGGQGTRLRPLTCNIPKPMMPILGKPVMQYTIELLKKNGITDIGVTLQYRPDEVTNYFGDGKEFGVNIKYFIEESPLGTAGSVKNAENFLNETFMVISGDALTDIDLTSVIKYHKQKKSTATIVLKEVSVPLEYGVVITDKEDRVIDFLEKPSWGEVFSDKVNTGIYILQPDIFTYYDRNQKFDFSKDLFPILLNNKRDVYGYITKNYWCDVGNIKDYMNCQQDILKGIVDVEILGQKYKDGIWIGENCEISPAANIVAPVYIGNGTKIYENTEIGPYSVLGKNTIVSSGATIKRSIVFNNCYIGSNAEVRAAVLCNKVQLESKVSVFEECAIGDETLIGQKAFIKPGIKIWPNKSIEQSVTVNTNIIWGGKFSKALFSKNGVNGEVNVDITPEFVSKLGSAYGSLLKYGGRVAISCSGDGAAEMFKYSLATGLLSIGAEVYDLMKMTLSITRHATTFFGVQGSIHVVSDSEDPQKISIVFMDKYGLNIDKSMERKIENSFIKEDFRRVKSDAFNKMTHFPDCGEYYSRQIVNKLNINAIRLQKFKIVLSINNSMLRNIVQNVFNEIKINVKFYEESKDIIGLSKEVISSNANMGIYISEQGDKGIFIDEKGNLIKDDYFDALKSLILLKTFKFSSLVVPVTASSTQEEIAKMCGAKFIRTKTSQKSILDGYIKNEKKFSKKEIINNYLMSLDVVCIMMLTINLMTESNISLFNLMMQIPKYYLRKQDILCPWNMKGMVMRNLIENNSSNFIDLIEGVKFNFDEGWALVLPDSDEPFCRVYAEAKHDDEAEKLSRQLAKKIRSITGINIEYEEKVDADIQKSC